MLKYLETTLGLYAAVLQALGSTMLSLAKISLSAVPVMKTLITTLDRNKYYHLKLRINVIRDKILDVATEIILLSKQMKAAAGENRGDFEFLERFCRMAEAEMSGTEVLFDNITSKVAEQLSDSKESSEVASAWIKSSPSFEAFEVALQGPVVRVTLEEFKQVLQNDFYANEGSSILSRHLSIGDSIQEAYEGLIRVANGVIEEELSSISGLPLDSIEKPFKGTRYIILLH